MPDMKKCVRCDVELPEDAMFCPECGTRQAEPSAVETVAVPGEDGTKGPEANPAPAAPVSLDPFAAKPAAPPSTPSNLSAAQSFQYAMPTPPPAEPPAYAPPPVNQPPQPSWQQSPQMPQPPMQPPPGWQPGPGQHPPAPGKASKMKEQKAAGLPGEKLPGKLPIPTIVILGLSLIGLVYWFLMYNSPNLPEFDFSAATANGVVFSYLLMTILAIAGAALFRFNMRGKKIAILGDILLAVVFLVMFYGISVTMFKDTNLFYKLFIGITGG